MIAMQCISFLTVVFWFGCVLLSSCQNSACLDTFSTEFEIWSAMASAVFKRANSIGRVVSSCFVFYLPVATSTIAQVVFLQSDSVTEYVESGWTSGNFLFS